MDDVSLDFAKNHLEDLLARAARGEPVQVTSPEHGTFKLVPIVPRPATASKRCPGRWKGQLTVPARLLEPLTDDELKWLSGELSP